MINIYTEAEALNKSLFKRADNSTPREIEERVSEILDNISKNGDSAVFELCERFDGAKLSSLRVSEEELDDAYSSIEPDFLETLKLSAENIFEFHKKQARCGFKTEKDDGIVVGQRVLPLSRVGIYVPGGTASYPSTVLMNAIPAIIAGVPEIVMTTPPGKNGKIAPVILAAAKLLGIKEIYKIGGAQAVGTLAYGTETIARVDKIVGPGNIYVATAKKQVFGMVDIDMIAGPSEILIVADSSAKASFVAADMLSQAEHDKLASAHLLCTSRGFADAVSLELEKQLKVLPRCDIARESIENNGKIVVCDSIESAIALANEIAPEHLELCLDDPFAQLDNVKNAGSVFLGNYAPEPLGDYFAGPNHTLPTMGTARFASPLGVDDFTKRTSFIHYTEKALSKVSRRVASFAEREGLSAHARSITKRFEDNI